MRLNLDGSRDTSFNAPSRPNYIQKIILQPDGRILVLATYDSISGIFRLNSNSSVDTSFNTGTNASLLPGYSSVSSIYNAVVQSDGKIVISGEFDSFNGIARSKLARLNADGTLDEGFNAENRLLTYNYNRGVNIFKSNDKIMMSGFYSDFYSGVGNLSRIDLTRLNFDGTVDESFIPQFSIDRKSFNPITSIQTQTDGKILIVGGFHTSDINFNKGNNSIIRLNADGSIDTTFAHQSAAQDPFRASTAITQALIENSGKIILVGNFEMYADVQANGIIRINTDGSVDSSFLTRYGYQTQAAILQSDGKIVIGGYRKFRRLLSDVNLGLLSEKAMMQNVLVYPNPVKNMLKIKSPIAISGIEIYNSIGQLVSNQRENFSEKTIDMKSFPNGIYFVKITAGEQNEIRKIIKN